MSPSTVPTSLLPSGSSPIVVRKSSHRQYLEELGDILGISPSDISEQSVLSRVQYLVEQRTMLRLLLEE
jgi:hypothetical protein